MSRITRAKAAAVAEMLHIDEHALLELNSHDRKDILRSPTSNPHERAPLCEVSPNSATSTRGAVAGDVQPTAEKKAKRARKGKNNTTNTLNASITSAAPDEAPEAAVIPDGVQAAQLPASQAASNDLVKDIPELEASHLSVPDLPPATPPANAVGLTEDQRSKISAEQLSCAVDDVQTKKALGVLESSDSTSQKAGETAAAEVLVSEVPVERPVSKSPENMPNVPQTQFSTPSKHPGAAKPERDGMQNVGPDGEEYDQLEKAVVEASTPPRPSSRSPLIPAASTPTCDQLETAVLSATKSARSTVCAMSPNDVIEALDAQDEAVEKIAAQVPDVQDSPQKAQSKKSVPPVRLTKASQARISLAHGLPDAPSKAPAMGRPRQSVSQSSTSKRITSVSSAKSGGNASEDALAIKKEVIIPHSKPRPMSMQFKPPPPPAKSTKAPTRSNFQLPGEAVAAKFKAAREARQQKEAEEQKKKAFKARPAPNMNKTPTVRQTSTSKARETIISGKPLAVAISVGRPASVATSRPATAPRPTTSSSKSSATSARLSSAPDRTKALAVKKRPISMMASSTSKVRPATGLRNSMNKARPATVLGMNGRPRPSLAPKPNPPAANSVRPTFQAGKGKEVFNRAAEAKASAEQQKREKKEAAKRARLEASERSRQLSRDWAEKQRMKKTTTLEK